MNFPHELTLQLTYRGSINTILLVRELNKECNRCVYIWENRGSKALLRSGSQVQMPGRVRHPNLKGAAATLVQQIVAM